jgi:hypothetical protein
LSLHTSLSRFFLKRFLRERKDTSSTFKLAENNYQSLLLVFQNQTDVARIVQSIKTIAGRTFSRIDYIIFTDNKSENAPEKGILSTRLVGMQGKFSAKGTQPVHSSAYDIIVDMCDVTELNLIHYLLKLSPQLFVRFNKEKGIFYNFIVPTGQKDLLARFEQFYRIFQTLSK